MGSKRSIGDRMKDNYENRARYQLIRRTPVIMRLDGKCFHTVTRGCKTPFDARVSGSLQGAALDVLTEVQGAKCAYLQSDEINILISDFDRLDTEAWFDYNIQKMASVAASICSVAFTREFHKTAYFDCRVFNIPESEVCNYFVWRQKDWERNSLFMYASSIFSKKQLFRKSKADMHEMLHRAGQNWASLSGEWKNGIFIVRNGVGIWSIGTAPLFTKDRASIESLMIYEE